MCKELQKRKIHFKVLIRKKEKEGIFVKNPSEKSPDFYKKLFEKYRINKIIHLAAISRETKKPWKEYYRINVEWTKNLYEGLKKTELQNKSFTFISTVGVYGMPPKKIPCSINDKLNPNGKYHISKALAEKELIKIKEKNTRLVILRSSIIYSKNDPGSSLKKLYDLFLSKKFPLIKKTVYHYTGMENVINYCIKSINKGKGIFNAVDAEPITSKELVTFFYKKRKGGSIHLPKTLVKLLIYLIPIEKYKIKLGILCDWCYTMSKTNKIFKPRKTFDLLEEYFKNGSAWQ